MVMTVHKVAAGDPPLKLGERLRSVFTFSDALRVELVNVRKVPRELVRVIHNGIEPGESPAPAPWGAVTPRAITVARLDPVKDQQTLLRAARTVADRIPDVRIEIVGDGPERGALERLSRELQLQECLRFLGYREDVPSLLRRPQIFILSSISEGISLGLLEAMAAGLPVVATDVGGNREVVVDEVTGLLVPPRSPAALADAVLSLLLDPGRARALGIAGRARLEREFDLGRTVSRYGSLYSELLARR